MQRDTSVRKMGIWREYLVRKLADMNPQALSKTLSNEDTPLIDVLTVVLKALDY